MATTKHLKWIKPLKKSEKVRLRKELEKRKKEERFGPRLTGDKWVYKQ